MGGLVYSGKFEEHINELYSPENISKTAKKFKEYEKKNGPYAFGKFTKFLVPKKENWAGESGSTQRARQVGKALRRHSQGDPRQDYRSHRDQSEVAQPDAAGAEGRRECRWHA